MTPHAKLSPSAADRWMTCPGSVWLSEGMPSTTNAYAEEGTLAHALGARCLDEALDAHSFVGQVFEYEDHGQNKTAVITEEMAGNVMVYVDHVRSLGGLQHYEQVVAVDERVYGTADAGVWQENARALHIIDLKYGAGLRIEVVDNFQLKIYALATLLTFGYRAETVTATIVQPRCQGGEGAVRSATYSVVELLDFHADLLDAIARVEQAKTDPTQHLVPSEKGCRWCLAAPTCPALKSKAQELAKQVFAPGAPYDAAELAQTLDYLPLLEGWIKNVREFAYAEAERGREIPDWKLVDKRATRKWRDENFAAAQLQGQGLAENQIYERKIITPAMAEKILPKDQRALLDELCAKESSGHALVHASDKRPAIKLDAKSAFS